MNGSTQSPTAPAPLADSSATVAQGRMLSQLLGLEFLERLPDPSPPRNPARGDFDRIAGSWGRQFLTVPIGGDDNHVVVATADPLNVEAIDQLRICYERPLKVVVSSPDEITKAINAIRTSLMSDRSSSLSESGKKDDGEDFNSQLKIDVTDADDDDAPIIRYVNAIIFKASSERASDVHIERSSGLIGLAILYQQALNLIR